MKLRGLMKMMMRRSAVENRRNFNSFGGWIGDGSIIFAEEFVTGDQ